ncbi:MAG TPA: UDP-4-amino-4,6-dideoxy-N-acetyl-beta-L-altrosamine transaminase [Deltaproteobacteria bacterium]|nr:UDP-4-amino-4,6-dideoxy-N-acetyl-beta-L-altrosamine transaminase [Deltaproteobacteria bacterium]
MRARISYGSQSIDSGDAAAVADVLVSPNLTQGPAVRAFEDALREYTGARYCVSCSSGTAALHLACLALGLGPSDRVVTSPVTFFASANCALYVGARPEFADIDPETANLSPARLEERLHAMEAGEGAVTGAVIAVHYAGTPCDMEALAAAARRHGMYLIEDACHALGAWWTDSSGRRRVVGDCALSEMTVFSFHPVKSITTGEGGAVTTNDETLYRRLLRLRNHGVERDPSRFVHEDPARPGRAPGPWYHELRELGFNYRLSDIHCALGASQMKRLDGFIERRNEIAALYDELFSGLSGVAAPSVPPGRRSARHLYPLRIDFDGLGVDKVEWFSAMDGRGIALQVHYIPVHLQPLYRRRLGYGPGDFPEAERFYRREASLPIYPLLSDGDARRVADAAAETLAGLSP